MTQSSQDRDDDDGLDIHWDETKGDLSLECYPGAFERFRRVVREELRDLPDIDLDRAVTITITDTRAEVANRQNRRSLVNTSLLLVIALLLLIPWVVGLGAIVKLLFGRTV